VEHLGHERKYDSGYVTGRRDVAQGNVAGAEVDGKEIYNGITKQAVGDAVVQLLAVHMLPSYSFFCLAEVFCLGHGLLQLTPGGDYPAYQTIGLCLFG
jgi:hypothetical protein